MHRGSELLRDGRPMEARDLLLSAVAIAPADSSAKNLLALSCFQAGLFHEAIMLYRSVVHAHPDKLPATINLALAHLKAGQPEHALAYLESVVERSPDHRRAWGYLGICLEQLGRIDEAESALVNGHFATAARRLRERHRPSSVGGGPMVDVFTPKGPSSVRPSEVEIATPFPPGLLPTTTTTTSPAAAFSSAAPPSPKGVSRPVIAHARTENSPFRETQRPRDADDEVYESSGAARITSPLEGEGEIPMENTVMPPAHSAPGSAGAPEGAPERGSKVVQLLDAALSSLLVVPHEASVQPHGSGLVLIGLEAKPDGDPAVDGFAARVDAVEAYAGRLERLQLRSPADGGPLRFRAGAAPFMRWHGTGQLVLSPLPNHRLFPVEMDADVAFLREELVVAFDHRLLMDLGRIRTAGDDDVSIVRFRGDGVVVLELEQPFLSFDVKDQGGVVLRVDSLIGWIGVLVPERVESHDGRGDDPFLLRFTGEGTLLFRAPQLRWPQ